MEWVQVCNTAGWEHPFILFPEHIPPGWHHTEEPLLLSHEQAVHVQFRAYKFCQDLRLKQLKLFRIRCRQFNIYSGMQKWLFIPVHL